MSTVEFPDGQVIRDSAAIVEHFEEQAGHTFSPATPEQRFFSRLIDLFGQEGMLRPGMHYHDEIPRALIELLRVMAEDFVPEAVAAADTINTWLEAQGTIEPGTPFERGVGFAEFEVRGQRISALAQPYRFWRLKIVQDEYAAFEANDRKAVEAILDSCNMTPVLGATLSRQIGRKDKLEVWL